MKKMIYIMLILIISSTLVTAEETIPKYSVFYQLYVKHINETKYNEDNMIVGVTYKDYIGCTFNNSFYQRSWFFGKDIYNKELFSIKKHSLDLHVYLVALYGYPTFLLDVDGWGPAAAPTFEYKYKLSFGSIGSEMFYVPADNGGTVISVLKVRF